MPIDDETHIEFMNQTSKALGGIAADISNTLAYVKSVSKSQQETRESLDFHIDEDAKKVASFNAHIADNNAHGYQARREVGNDIWSFLGKVLTILVSTVSVLIALFAFLGKWWPK